MIPMSQQNMISKFNEFRRNFNGNPQEEVQKLLDSGQMSQADFERLSQMETMLQSMFR